MRQSRHLADDHAVNRRLVCCGLVDPDTFRVEASDGTVWLHHVERDEQGKPIPEQIDGWPNLIWVPAVIDVLNDTVAPSGNCSQSRESGLTTAAAGPTNAPVRHASAANTVSNPPEFGGPFPFSQGRAPQRRMQQGDDDGQSPILAGDVRFTISGLRFLALCKYPLLLCYPTRS